MASITANGSKGHHKFILNVSEASYSVANNTSSVSFSFQIAPIQTSWNWELWGDKISYSITINGTNYSGTIPAYDGYSTVTLKSGSLTVAHNSDGGKSISYSFSVTDSTGQSYTSGTASASGTLALTTIPRATTPTLSATSVTMGSAVTITMTPASNTFKHKIRYAFGGVTNSVLGLSIGENFTASGTTTATLTPPVSLGNQIPQAMSGNCTITCYTYTSAGAHIGTTTVNLTLNVPAYEPFIDSIALAGNNLLSSTYVQNKSTVTAEIVAWSSYGATITSYSSVVDGKTYTGRTFTTSALSSGTKNVKTTVTDSRGKTATITNAGVTVYAYSNPYITKFTLSRDADGTTVTAKLEGGVSSVNGKNAKTFSVTLNGVTKTITSTTNTVNGTATFTGVSTDKTFEAVAKITDSYTNVSKTAVLPTVAVTMDFYKDGNGIAMGKVAEEGNLLDVAWSERIRKNLTVDGTSTVGGTLSVTGALTAKGALKAETSFEVSSGTFGAAMIKRNDSANAATIRFANTNGVLGAIGMTSTANGGIRRWTADTNTAYTVLDTGNLTDHIKDYVVERGTSGVWTYRKWNSGFAECWGYHTVSGLNINTAWGSWFSSSVVTLPSFPFTFSGAPDVHVNWESDFSAIIDGVGKRESTKAGQVYLYRPVAQTNINGRFGIYAYGRWK